MIEDLGTLNGYSCRLSPTKGNTITVDGHKLTDKDTATCEIDLAGKITVIKVVRE